MKESVGTPWFFLPRQLPSRLPRLGSLELMQEGCVSGLVVSVWFRGPTTSKLPRNYTKVFFAFFILLLS